MSTAERPGAVRDTTHMRRALSLARRGWGRTAPNPLVGAVVVRDGIVVGEGFHAEYGSAHAEVAALGDAGENARGATIYVTLEPCTHHGKTPPCTDALIAAGVARVVAAVSDPSPTAGGGQARLRSAGIDVEVGVEREAACELNAPFFHALRATRPWMVLKLALSIDGAIAGPSRARGWLTGESARAEVHRLRAGHEAIAVGLGTVVADDPALTVRGRAEPRVAPARVVFDDDALIPLDSVLVRTARETRTIVVVRDPAPERIAALEARGVSVLAAPTLRQGLTLLRAEGLRSVLVEGGAGLAGRLLSDALVDRLVIFRAPVVLGEGALGAFSHAPGMTLDDAQRLPVIETRTFGVDTMTVYAMTPTPCSPD